MRDRDAAQTWALIVGIDEYDDPDIPDLRGAALDAAAIVAWLRVVGVPDPQIALHTAPCAAAQHAIDVLGLQVMGCTEPEIWRSIRDISALEGERLFVFLMGHGVFEPSGGPLVLTREACVGAYSNLGIELHARQFRSYKFRQQFLIMDGCLNYPYSPHQRREIQPGLHNGVVTDPTPNVDATLVVCLGAAQGEVADEPEGRGLFLKHFLTAVDPAQPTPVALELDTRSGDLLVDISKVIKRVVSPSVQDESARLTGKQQNPGLSIVGRGERDAVTPLLRLAPDPVVRLRLTIAPSTAVGDVQRLTLAADAGWATFAPVPPATTLPAPVEAVVPAGSQLDVHCILKPGSSLPRPATKFVSVPDGSVAHDGDPFDVQLDIIPDIAPPSPNTIDVVTLGPGGGIAYPMNTVLYDEVGRVVSDTENIEVEEHEHGPSLRGGDLQTAMRVARTIASETDAAVNVAVVLGADIFREEPGVRVQFPTGGAASLAGFASSASRVYIGETERWLTDLEREPVTRIDPGHVDVRLVLPWAEWSSRVDVDDGAVVDLQLPDRVGNPPLRVALYDKLRDGGFGAGAVVRVSGAPGEPVELRAGITDEWDPQIADIHWYDTALVETSRGSVAFPLHARGTVAFTSTPAPRAEPLSVTQEPSWDALVASGQLDGLTNDDAVRLADGKWDDPLVGVAGAYALFAQHRGEELDTVLFNLKQMVPDIPDVAVLAAMREAQTGRRDRETAAEVERVAAASAVPLFAWGVPLAVFVARDRDLGDWEERCTFVDDHRVTTSVWTAWTASS